MQEIWSRFPATLELTLISTCFALAVGITLGVVSATAHNSRLDLATTIVSVLACRSRSSGWDSCCCMCWASGSASCHLGPARSGDHPPRVTGLVLVDSLIQQNWEALSDGLKHLVLPAFTLSVIPVATISRMTRTSMVEVLQQDYIAVARAKASSSAWCSGGTRSRTR